MQQYHAINTDLYELTMAAGYFDQNHNHEASFDLFTRKLPENRNYLVVAGIEQAMDYINNLEFSDKEVDYLRSLPTFRHVNDEFFDYLRSFRFTGDVYAMDEGEIAFPDESILQVHAPIVEAQILETYLLATIQHQTMIASKAARVVHTANSYGQERPILEFGSRRAHGPEAGVLAGRAAYIAGAKGTSNTLAGFQYGMPVSGTMAHAWIMSFEDEMEAFQQFHDTYREQAILLVDTYDTLEGVRKATKLNKPFRGVRLDSGDLIELSKEARKILDDAGYQDAQIFASGDLNEYRIKEVLDAGAPIDAFGVGTQLSTAADAPYLQMVYKLSEYSKNEHPEYRLKLSKNKQTLPGLKQVYRYYDGHGRMDHDEIALMEEKQNDGTPLVHPYFENGELKRKLPDIQNIRAKTLNGLKTLPPNLHNIEEKAHYPVKTTQQLDEVTEQVTQKILQQAQHDS